MHVKQVEQPMKALHNDSLEKDAIRPFPWQGHGRDRLKLTGYGVNYATRWGDREKRQTTHISSRNRNSEAEGCAGLPTELRTAVSRRMERSSCSRYGRVGQARVASMFLQTGTARTTISSHPVPAYQ